MPAPPISRRRSASMSAARRIDEDRVAFHLRQRRRVDHGACFIGQRTMQADDVARSQQLIQVLDAIDADGDLDAARDVGIVGYDIHTERFGADRGRDADASEPDDAEYSAAQSPNQRRAGAGEAAAWGGNP